MRFAEFLVIHKTPTGVIVHEHVGTRKEYGPPPRIKTPWIVDIPNSNAGIIGGNTLFAELIRPTGNGQILDGGHISLDVNNPQKVLWAFNLDSGINSKGDRFTGHGANGIDSDTQNHVSFHYFFFFSFIYFC